MRLQVWSVQGRAFHFGHAAGLGMECSAITWPSDSLFAALVARLAARESPDAVEAGMRPFEEGDPPFLLTSTFPAVFPPEGKPVLFFPVPLTARRPTGKPPSAVRPKDLKRVRFVSEGVYRALLAGKTLAGVYPQAQRAGQGALLLAAEDWARLPSAWRREGEGLTLWQVTKRPRVTVGRTDNRSNLFHVGAVHYREGAGLWFGVLWRHDDAFWAARFQGLLEDLGESGLGAERSVGYGQAALKPLGDLELPDPRADGPWTLLSRYWPRADEMPALQKERAAYELVRVGGWVDGVGQRRRVLHMVAEGAVLGSLRHPGPYGAVADVRPRYPADPDPLGHAVYRYGYALAVGYGGAA